MTSTATRAVTDVGVTLAVLGAWAALGAADIALWFLARADGHWIPAAVVAALAVVALSAATVVVLRRPTPRWPWPGAIAGAMIGTVVILALLGVPLVVLGLGTTFAPDDGSGFAGEFLPQAWTTVGAAFLPVVAMAEALVLGDGESMAQMTVRAAVRRVVMLVAAGHLLWFALEVAACLVS
ncbi:hypothetical protein EDF46_2777 [Frondihabitans sp. PhB188]|uniref:hypothetical protein n=1 Tax=Frondihabitans sp. PhB188 TaxID=2485200 RepID=UPI000F47FC6E|nr:hypothetical protein [Frondihabitans sp. PhB188]ROQ37321.1 hypothetical protein EDF46_2777 [Frondihabitans sp. PhB188]